MATPLPGTMIVDQPQDPWDTAFAQYRQALVDLDGDGVPDAVVQAPAGDQRPPQAFDPDGRPRVPASGGSNPYPFPAGAMPPNPNLLQRIQSDPVGNALIPAFGGAMNALAATGDAMGPTGMPISMLGRMGRAAIATPGAAVGRGPNVQFQIDRTREALRPLLEAESRAGVRMPPSPMPRDSEPELLLNALLQRQSELEKRTPMVREALAGKLDEFNTNVRAVPSQASRAIPYDEQATIAAVRGTRSGNMRAQQTPTSYGYVRPEVDPGRIAAAQRSEEAIRRGRIDMELRASAERYANSPPEVAKKIDDTMQNMLGNVGRTVDSADGAVAKIPKGAYERYLADEPALSMLAQRYGMTLDEIMGALTSRGYATPGRVSPFRANGQPFEFNANVMLQQRPGGGGSLPMSPQEKALRDALWRQNPQIGVPPQGDVF